MRTLISLVACLCLAGPAFGTTVWTEDFTGPDGNPPAGWTILAGNGGTMSIKNNTLFISSAGDGYASGYADPDSFPELAAWDQTLPYRVEFDFMIPDTNNHWFFVYVDKRVSTVIDYYNQFVAYGAAGGGNITIANLTTNQWYHLRYDVVPGWGYDVYLDGAKKVAKVSFVDESWEPFRIGDRADGSYDKGTAYWDNMTMATNIPEPLTMGSLALGLTGLCRYLRRRR